MVHFDRYQLFLSVNFHGSLGSRLTKDIKRNLSMVHTRLDVCVADCPEIGQIGSSLR
jgi:hypothetical protein